jgi:hypothetical protein
MGILAVVVGGVGVGVVIGVGLIGVVSGFGDGFIGGIWFGFKFELLIAGAGAGAGVGVTTVAGVIVVFVGGLGGAGIGTDVACVIGLISGVAARVALGAGASVCSLANGVLGKTSAKSKLAPIP